MFGHFEGDGHAAPRQREDQHVRTISIICKPRCQLPSTIFSILKDHCPFSPLASAATVLDIERIKCPWNHSAARRATSSSVPVSSKRCVAPGTISNFFSQRSCL